MQAAAACVVALAPAMLAVGMLAPSSAQAAPAAGVVLNGPAGISPQTNSSLSALGVPWVREFVSWATLEPARGHISSPQVAGLAATIGTLPSGTKVILDVLDTPQWESGSANPLVPPANPADYAAFVGKLARSLGNRVAAYEIWNEEDSSAFWATGPNPSQYAALLRVSYRAIKRANRHATVVLGGLTGNDWEFLAQLYRHGAKGYFDAVGVHTDTACDVESPYEYEWSAPHSGHISRWSFLGYRTVYAVERAHHDDKPIWMTELGWSTYPGECNTGAWSGQKPGGVSQEAQATYLRQAYHCLAQNQYVKVAIWFGLQDLAEENATTADFGLLGTDLQQTPAFSALSAYAHQGDTLHEPCGDFHGPSITISDPVGGQHLTGNTTVALGASDPFGVERITLELDHHQHLRTFTAHPALAKFSVRWFWYDAAKLSPGRHVFEVLAIDERGNESRRSMVIWRTR